MHSGRNRSGARLLAWKQDNMSRPYTNMVTKGRSAIFVVGLVHAVSGMGLPLHRVRRVGICPRMPRTPGNCHANWLFAQQIIGKTFTPCFWLPKATTDRPHRFLPTKSNVSRTSLSCRCSAAVNSVRSRLCQWEKFDVDAGQCCRAGSTMPRIMATQLTTFPAMALQPSPARPAAPGMPGTQAACAPAHDISRIPA